MGSRTEKVRQALKAAAASRPVDPKPAPGVSPDTPAPDDRARIIPPKGGSGTAPPKKNARDRQMGKFRFPVGTKLSATMVGSEEWSAAITIPRENAEPEVIQGVGPGIHGLLMRLGRAWKRNQESKS